MTARISLPDGGRTATIESKTNFFAGVPKGDTAHAVCMPLHRGRTTIVLETRITRGDGKLAAIVTQTQLIFDANDNNAWPAPSWSDCPRNHRVKPRWQRPAGRKSSMGGNSAPAHGVVCPRTSAMGDRHDGPQRFQSKNGHGAPDGDGAQDGRPHPVGM